MRLAFERDDVEVRGIVDQGELALRRERVDDGGKVLLGGREPGDILDFRNADRLQLGVERAAMVDDIVRAHALHPGDRLGPRRGGDDSQARQTPRDLDQDRADAAGAVDDEKRAGLRLDAVGYGEAIKTRVPTR